MPDELLARLKAVAETHDVLRIKGFVAVAGKPLRLAVQGVGTRFRSSFDRPWPNGRRATGPYRGDRRDVGSTAPPSKRDILG